MTWHYWAACADSDLEPAAWTDRADDMQWGRSDANRAALDTCRILCGDCGEKIRDVMALAAALGLSAYELCAAVMQ